eukprot:920598-Prymnesium_polylepis.2
MCSHRLGRAVASRRVCVTPRTLTRRMIACTSEPMSCTRGRRLRQPPRRRTSPPSSSSCSALLSLPPCCLLAFA